VARADAAVDGNLRHGGVLLGMELSCGRRIGKISNTRDEPRACDRLSAGNRGKPGCG
jgi:hypothetical protein